MQEVEENEQNNNDSGASSMMISGLLWYLGDTVAESALRRARLYVDLFSNPPPPPHPFGVFLEDVERLNKAAAAKATASHNPAFQADTGEETDAVAELPSLLELLRKAHGYSSGSAMYRMWVRYPQEYLSFMAQQIADLVTTRVMPAIVCDKHGEKGPRPSVEVPDGMPKLSSTNTEKSNQYDVHVRFIPSFSPHFCVSAAVSEVFCAEIIVRDMEALRRVEEKAALLRAQYTSVAAEGQTVQGTLAFWRSVMAEAFLEEGDKGASADCVSSAAAVVLGRCSDPAAAGGACRWTQPPAQRMRGGPTGSSQASGMSEAQLQSVTGLVAVFYLAFSGVLYAGAPSSIRDGEAFVAREPRRVEESGLVEEKAVASPAPEQQMQDSRRDVKPVFFLPCASSTSFVRGLLGL